MGLYGAVLGLYGAAILAAMGLYVDGGGPLCWCEGQPWRWLRGAPMGLSWGSHGALMVLPWGSHGSHALSWDSRETLAGLSWGSHWAFIPGLPSGQNSILKSGSSALKRKYLEKAV